MNKKISDRVKKIKIVLTDVDGVLTDGGMYYTSKGDIMKKFHVRDGMGVTLLRKIGIPTIIVTKERTQMVKQWSRNMRISKLFDGVKQKELIIEKICKQFNVEYDEVAYIGDDINDVELLKKVGFSAVPNDAIDIAKQNCNYICKTKAGNGALREIAEIILSAKAKS